MPPFWCSIFVKHLSHFALTNNVIECFNKEFAQLHELCAKLLSTFPCRKYLLFETRHKLLPFLEFTSTKVKICQFYEAKNDELTKEEKDEVCTCERVAARVGMAQFIDFYEPFLVVVYLYTSIYFHHASCTYL